MTAIVFFIIIIITVIRHGDRRRGIDGGPIRVQHNDSLPEGDALRMQLMIACDDMQHNHSAPEGDGLLRMQHILRGRVGGERYCIALLCKSMAALLYRSMAATKTEKRQH